MTTEEDNADGSVNAGDGTQPALRIITPETTPEEVAAIVAVLSSLGTSAPAPKRRTPEWSAHHRAMRRTLPHGPGGWRSSGLPR